MKSIILCCGQDGKATVYGKVESYPVPGEPVTLYDARMILEWTGGGIFGVASRGPNPGSRITHAVPCVMETVWQEWIECTPEAASVIEEYPAC